MDYIQAPERLTTTEAVRTVTHAMRCAPVRDRVIFYKKRGNI